MTSELSACQPLLFEGKGQIEVTKGEGHFEVIQGQSADITDSVPSAHLEDRNSVKSTRVKVNAGTTGERLRSSGMRSPGNLSAVEILRCEKCDKSCAMCLIHRAQEELKVVIDDINSGESTSQFCSCNAHKHIHYSQCKQATTN